MKALIIKDTPDMEELRKKKPFSSAGSIAFRRILQAAGVAEKDCVFVTLTQRYPLRGDFTQFLYTNKEAKAVGMQDTKGLFPREELRDGIAALITRIETEKPDIIITLGNYSLWALMQDSFSVAPSKGYKVVRTLNKWHGSQLRYGYIPLLPTFSPRDCFTNRAYFYKMRQDILSRVPLMLYADKWEPPNVNFLIRPSYDDTVSTLLMLIEQCDKAQTLGEKYAIAVDIETRFNHIACVGFAWSKSTAICIPLLTSSNDKTESYWNGREEIAIVILMKKLLTHPAIAIRGQNFLFDAQFFALYWSIIVHIEEDTMIMQHLLFPGLELNLGELSSFYCAYHCYWKDEGKNWNPNVGEEQLWIYNCKDVAITYEVADEQLKFIKYYNQEEQWKTQQRQLQSILRMMIRGVKVNLEAKHTAKYELEARVEEYQKRLEEMLPESVYPRKLKQSAWYSSPKQVAEIFHEVFGLKRYFNRKVRRYTVDDAALEHFGNTEPVLRTLTDLLRDYRSLSTFRTFTEMKLDVDNRMRCSFTPTAETYRWKSSANVFGTGGNFQNLPKGNEDE